MMKNVALVQIVMIAITSLGITATSSLALGEGDKQVRVNVGYNSWKSAQRTQELATRHLAQEIQKIEQINMITYHVPARNMERFRQALLATGSVGFVERDSKSSIPPGEVPVLASAIPNDPAYAYQWGHHCIDAEAAWDQPSLSSNPAVIVAVIDTGIDWNHPDLVDQVDTSIDYDFVNDDADAMDDNGHGTHCAGIIAAGFNNSTGIAGLQDVTLMGVKGFDSNGSGWNSIIANALIYAANNGANVISLSWGGYQSSRALAQATLYAYNKDIVLVAAAGNDNTSLKHYPSAYPWVVGVGALVNCTHRVSFSNYGAENVLIVAPGSNILSTYLNDTYALMSGTSMACPHVAAIAAMLIGAYLDYADLTPLQVIYILGATADDIGSPGRDNYYGYGRVDMYPWAD